MEQAAQNTQEFAEAAVSRETPLGTAVYAAERPPTGQKSLWPLVAAFAVFFCAVLGVMAAGSFELDRFARSQTRTLAEAAVAKAVSEVAFLVRDYSFWDAALENLIGKPDELWADANIGTYAWQELGMSRTLALGPDDAPIFSMMNGETSSGASLFGIAPPLLRLAEAARESAWDDPRPASAFLSLDGRIFIASASAVTPEKPAPEEIGTYRRGVLIFFRELDENLLKDMSASYQLEGLQLLPEEADGKIGTLPLAGDGGNPVAHLGWVKPNPGLAFLRQTAPWVAAILLTFAGLMVILLRRAYAQAATVERLNGALLRRSEELELSKSELAHALEESIRANKAKTDFLAIMSHELRTPLNAVIGFSDLIRNQTFGPIGQQKYVEYGNDIYTSGQHLLSLISDILDVTRANEGILALDRRPIELSSLVSKCLTLVTPQAVRRRIAIDVAERQAPNIVMGDEVRLTQILINLVSNALKGSQEGSRIRIRISRSVSEIVLRVIDTGHGIPKEELGAITEPFRQAGTYQAEFNPYSSENAGTGLGLAVVKRLTEAHGGRLHIASRVGLGTVVEVRLPRAEETALRKSGNRAAR